METSRPRTARRACSVSGRSNSGPEACAAGREPDDVDAGEGDDEEQRRGQEAGRHPPEEAERSGDRRDDQDDQVVGRGHAAPLVDERADQQVHPDDDDTGREDADRKDGNYRSADGQSQGAGHRDDPARRWPRRSEPMGKDRLRHRMVAPGAAAGGRREVGDPDGAQVAVGIDAAAERDLERRGAHRRPDDRDADGGGDARRLREERAAFEGQWLPVEQRPEQAVAAERAEEQPRLVRRIDAGSRKGEGHVEQPAGQHEPKREDDRPAEAPGQHADRQRGEQPRRPADRIAGVEEEIAGCRVEAAGRAPCRAPRRSAGIRWPPESRSGPGTERTGRRRRAAGCRAARSRAR